MLSSQFKAFTGTINKDVDFSDTKFVPCGAFDSRTVGFAPLVPEGEYLHKVGDHHVIAVVFEEKILPSSVIAEEVKKRCDEHERVFGCAFGRLQLRELKDVVANELRAKAFTKRHRVLTYLSGNSIYIGATGAKQEDVLHLLVKSGLVTEIAKRFDTAKVGQCLTSWYLDEAPAAMKIGNRAKLANSEKGEASVKGMTDEFRDSAIASGATVTSLSLQNNAGTVFFDLTSNAEFKRVDSDFKTESEPENAVEQFEADAILTIHAFSTICELVEDAINDEVSLDE